MRPFWYTLPCCTTLGPYTDQEHISVSMARALGGICFEVFLEFTSLIPRISIM